MKWAPDEFAGRRFGKYEVLCRLAVGGMAEIFLGFGRAGPFTGRAVVIKRILAEQREDPTALQMLLDEARLTATLSHSNIAQVMDLEVDGEEVLLVIEFIAGANIEEVVESSMARKETVPLGFAIAVVREAAQGLSHAHTHKNAKGELVPVVHRDVTPRNVMVDFDGAVKMLDFGIARAKGSERRTQAGMVRGTTAYMSPEQAIGKDLDPRSDLFSLGTIFHELLTGQRLFYRGNPGQEMAAVYESEIPVPSTVNKRVPRALDAVVMRMLERKLEKRYQSAVELVRDLSLAAQSTAWGKEKCGEFVRERFASRQRDIEKLLARIPKQAPPSPEARTLVARGGVMPVRDEDESPRTLVGTNPLGFAAGAARPTEPVREVATDPGRPPVLAAPQPPAPGLREEDLFNDSSEEGARTRIIPGGSLRALPRVAEAPTDPRRQAVKASQGPSGAVMALVGVLLAIVAGAALYVSGVFRPAPAQPPALVRVAIEADRPCELFLGAQALGRLPLTAIIPAGSHLMEVKEEDGTRRKLVLELDGAKGDATVALTLDSLPPLP
jgi:serine/threonine protein kinase